jgi:hypothetical protein
VPKIAYKNIFFSQARQTVIDQANEIIEEYAAQGFDLTLRQLYYQFVSRDLIKNDQKEYKRLGDIINDARLAGLIDWDHITDRTRNLRSLSHWETPADIMASAAASFRIDKWARQKYRIEVWVEKDALVGVLEGVCNDLDVPYFSCRGYTSQSEMWAASQRLLKHEDAGQEAVILHLGDHDPSGIDMSRDIQDRLELFTYGRVTFERLALNMPQVRQYNPPPNPAKLTDSRCTGYMEVHGDQSWELDALEPTVIADLIRKHVGNYRNEKLWKKGAAEERRMRGDLDKASDRWADVAKFLHNGRRHNETRPINGIG